MKIACFIALLLVLSGPVLADEDKYSWTEQDTALAAAFMVLHAVDWRQTVYISQSNGLFREVHPFTKSMIGEHPSHGDVNRYFLSMSAVQVLAPALFPSPYRNYLQLFWIGGKGLTVKSNYSIGIKIRF